MIKKNSLVSEILLLLLIALAGSILTITAFNVYDSNKVINKEYLNNAKNACVMVNAIMEDFSEEINFITDEMAMDSDLVKALETDNMLKAHEVLMKLHNHLDGTENVFISKIVDDNYLEIIVASNRKAEGFIFAKPGEDYHENLVAALKNTTATSKPSLSPVTTRTVLLSTSPVRLNNDTEKYVMCYAQYLNAKLYDIISNFTIGNKGYAYIMRTDNGQMIAHPDTSLNWNITANDLELPSETFNVNNKANRAVNYIYKGKDKTVLPYVNEKLDFTVMGSFENDEVRGFMYDTIRANIIAILVILIVLSYVIIRVFTKKLAPLSEAEQVLKQISEGDLTQKVTINKGNNEITRLSASLDQTAEQIRNLIGETINSTAQLKIGSDELSKASSQINNGAASQAASVEEIATSIEEVNATVEQNAQNAQDNMEMTQEISAGMETLVNSNEEAVKQAKQMSSSLTNIAELATEIKLLSLNAAIESSQAGEFGKGFGVIATEIRKLAEHTQVLNDQISEIGTELFDKAQESQEICQRIVPLIVKNSDSSNEIVVASNEQRSSMGQISNAINELNRIAQSNTSTSEELSASAEELNQQTNQLTELVSFFKTEKQDDRKSKLEKFFKKENESSVTSSRVKNEVQNTNQGTKPKRPQGIPIELNREISEYERF